MIPGEYALLSVADTGQDMSAETKAHNLEPFITPKEVGRGTGLGLATVYGIVKQSGDFIWVESGVGKGETFEIYLSRSEKPATTTDDSAKAKLLRGGSETILVVEDETAVRELASEFLRARGYTILEAKDGAEAVRIIAAHEGEIHLLLTDMVMPRMSGVGLAQRLRKARPDFRVIYMTGYAEFSGKDGETGGEETSVLQKPFSRSTLLEKVREVLHSAPCSPPGGTKVGGPA